MKNLMSIFLTFTLATVACVPLPEKQDENIRTEEKRSLDSFNRISVGESIKLTIEKGNKNIARIETSGVDTRKVLLDIAGSQLKIHMENTKYKFWSPKSWSKNVKIHLTYTENLEAIRASSSSSIIGNSTIESDEMSIEVSSSARAELKVDADKLDIKVSSSADVDIEAISEKIFVDVTSSGRLSISGRSYFQEFNVSSSGKYRAFELQSEQAEASVSSSGSAEISVSNELTGKASSSGTIYYKGSPVELQVHTSSSGSVRKSN